MTAGGPYTYNECGGGAACGLGLGGAGGMRPSGHLGGTSGTSGGTSGGSGANVGAGAGAASVNGAAPCTILEPATISKCSPQLTH